MLKTTGELECFAEIFKYFILSKFPWALQALQGGQGWGGRGMLWKTPPEAVSRLSPQNSSRDGKFFNLVKEKILYEG